MISTKNIKETGSSATPKTLSPGNITFKINSIRTEGVPYKADALNIVLDVEGPDMGSDFEGFYIDKDDTSKGRYAGQVGKIKCSEYPYSDGVTPKGIEISREVEMLKMMKELCKATNSLDWLDSQDEKHDTMQSLIDQFNEDKPFKDQMLRACVSGKEYQNKNGYTNYDMYFSRFSKDSVPFENASIDESKSRVTKYNADLHIKKPKVTEVKSFGLKSTAGDDFDL